MPQNATKPKVPGRKSKRKAYHRGNVHRDLIALGRDILEKEGPDAITLRRLTREIGVNPTNFYNHFPHMDFLFAAIKAEGHRKLQACFHRAVSSRSNRKEMVRALGHEYVAFAIRHPNLYRLMFDQLHDFETHTELKEESDRTIALAVEVLYGEDVYDPSDSLTFFKNHPLAITCWSLYHGLSHILIERQIRIRLRSRKDVALFVDQSLDELIRGIDHQLKD